MGYEEENQDIKVALAASADERSERIRAKVAICQQLLRKVQVSYDRALDNRGTMNSLVSRLFDSEYSKIMSILGGLEGELKDVIEDMTAPVTKVERRPGY